MFPITPTPTITPSPVFPPAVGMVGKNKDDGDDGGDMPPLAGIIMSLVMIVLGAMIAGGFGYECLWKQFGYPRPEETFIYYGRKTCAVLVMIIGGSISLGGICGTVVFVIETIREFFDFKKSS